MNEIHTFLKSEIQKHHIILFMKGSAQFPQCGLSQQAVQILQHLEVNFHTINVLENDDIREGIKSYSQWPTIPQLYINQEFIGGCDIMKEMFVSGELQQVITQNATDEENT